MGRNDQIFHRRTVDRFDFNGAQPIVSSRERKRGRLVDRRQLVAKSSTFVMREISLFPSAAGGMQVDRHAVGQFRSWHFSTWNECQIVPPSDFPSFIARNEL